MAIKSKTIASIFLNFLFAVGVILAVFGFIRGLQFTAYSLILDDYPLQAYEETCDRYTLAKPALEPGEQEDPQEFEQIKQECLERVEKRRQTKQIEDITASIGFLVSGVALVYLFNPKSKISASVT